MVFMINDGHYHYGAVFMVVHSFFGREHFLGSPRVA